MREANRRLLSGAVRPSFILNEAILATVYQGSKRDVDVKMSAFSSILLILYILQALALASNDCHW